MPAQRGSGSLSTVTSGSVIRRLILCGLIVGAVAVIAGCGGSKPAFCKNRSELQKSVSGINVSGGVSSLKTQVQTIEGQAKSLVSSAKSDFPNETTAISTAVSNLQSGVKALPSSPTPAQLVSVGADVKNTVSSVSAFASATKSKCE
jgi:copper chaperone CopZ